MAMKKKIVVDRNEIDRFTAIDLFCGCGGLSLGLSYAGFDILAAIDSDPLACATYGRNHKSTKLIEGDITKTRPTYLRKQLGLDEGQLDLLAGCPPCQGFSTLRTLNGNRSVDEPMNDLVFQFLKYVRAFRPKAIMMENVPGLAKDTRLVRFRRQIGGLGYQSSVRVLDASKFGTPQRRNRMILVALLDGNPEFAAEAPKIVTVKDAIGSLLPPGTGGDPLHDYHAKRSDQVKRLIRRIPTNGGSRTDLPLELQLDCHKRCNGFKDIYGRMAWDRPSPTITGGCINPSKGRFLHPEQDRAITLREASLLQGFPESYDFEISKGKYPAAQMIGNAFPPKFAEHHARVIQAQLAENL